MRIAKLDELARELVGDGKRQNLYFVSLAGNIVTVTTDFETAYGHWRALPFDRESMIEDRRHGVICSREPIEEGSTRLITIDDSRWLLH
jgi:hypothetical protein